MSFPKVRSTMAKRRKPLFPGLPNMPDAFQEKSNITSNICKLYHRD